MRNFTSETIIVSKEAWKYLRNVERQRDGRAPLNDERLNAIWDRISFHNGGANPATHPIRKKRTSCRQGYIFNEHFRCKIYF